MKKTVLLFSLAALIGCSKSDPNIGKGPATVAPMSESSLPPEPAKPSNKKAPGKYGDTTVTASGLMYIDNKVGTGPSPEKGQKIKVNYTGMLVDGTKFDSNEDPEFNHTQPFETQIGVGQVIPGWDEGMLTMKVGGKRRLIVPSELGYGASGSGTKIPPNATLIFDVTLLGVE